MAGRWQGRDKSDFYRMDIEISMKLKVSAQNELKLRLRIAFFQEKNDSLNETTLKMTNP